MITLRRSAAAAGAATMMHDAVHRLFRVRVIRNSGGIFDEDIFFRHVAWTGRGERAVVNIVLAGHERVRCGDSRRWLGPGGVIGSRLHETYVREVGDPFLHALVIDWEPGSLGTRAPEESVGLLSRGEVARLTALAGALEQAEGPHIAVACADIFATLRAIGLPFDAHAPLEYAATGDADAWPLARALSDAFCRLEARPTLVDLENSLHLSRRQIHRKLASLSQRYALNGTNWRSMLDRWRLYGAAYLMSSGARTVDVARAVGYSDTRVLCDAFRTAGLPPPLQLCAAIAALA
jgi:AraC-like DNA-binding protein